MNDPDTNDPDTFAPLEESLATATVPPEPAEIAAAVHQRVNRELTASQAIDFATGALPYAGQHLAPSVWALLKLTCGGGIDRPGRR
jgi:hypothetical protein